MDLMFKWLSLCMYFLELLKVLKYLAKDQK